MTDEEPLSGLSNDVLRKLIRTNVGLIQETRDDESLTDAKARLIIADLQAQVDRAQDVLARRRRTGTYRKFEETDGKGRLLLISAAIYASVVIGAIALAPLTGGKSLAALAVVFVVVFIHGVLYALLG